MKICRHSAAGSTVIVSSAVGSFFSIFWSALTSTIAQSSFFQTRTFLPSAVGR